jgi:outer membrane lipoprotein-sorting protein
MNFLQRMLVVSSLLISAHCLAADAFEGKVSLAMSAEKGKSQTIDYTMKGQKLRMDINAEGQKMTNIMDMTKMEMTMLMPEQKMYMVHSIKKPVEQAMEKQGESTAVIEVTGKTETILGYKCNQILVKDKGTVTEMWAAEGLGAFMGMGGGGGSPFGGKKGAASAAKWEEALKGKGGFPLRVVTLDAKGKQTFKMEATKIEPGPQPDSAFVPPSDYQKMDMGNMMMPGLGGLNPFKKN